MNIVSNNFWNGLYKDDYEKNHSFDSPLIENNLSSTIFPIFISKTSEVHLVFLSYWGLRHNSNVAMELILRLKDGTIYDIKKIFIDEVKANRIILNSLFNLKIKENIRGFIYSLEVKVYSKSPPKFTYPALSILYKDKNGQSIVHAGSRVYNPDETKPSLITKLPQTGFDVIINNSLANYIVFTGGNLKKYFLEISFSKATSLILNTKIEILQNNNKQLHVLNIEDLIKLNKNDINNDINISIKLKNSDVFPRFYVGHYSENNIPTITHTFFDCSKKALQIAKVPKKKSHTYNLKKEIYFDIVFTVPVLNTNIYTTKLNSYNNNDFSKSIITIFVYDISGKFIDQVIDQEWNNIIHNFGSLNLSNFCIDNKLDPKITYVFKFAFSSDTIMHSSRSKFGLNYSLIKHEDKGCNICFGPLSYSESVNNMKKFSSRWGPVGGSENFVFYFHNFSFHKNTTNNVNEVEIIIYNSKKETFNNTITLIDNQTIFIDQNTDINLKYFLNGELGYVYIKSNLWSQDAFYISTTGNQLAGDHAF